MADVHTGDLSDRLWTRSRWDLEASLSCSFDIQRYQQHETTWLLETRIKSAVPRFMRGEYGGARGGQLGKSGKGHLSRVDSVETAVSLDIRMNSSSTTFA